MESLVDIAFSGAALPLWRRILSAFGLVVSAIFLFAFSLIVYPPQVPIMNLAGAALIVTATFFVSLWIRHFSEWDRTIGIVFLLVGCCDSILGGFLRVGSSFLSVRNSDAEVQMFTTMFLFGLLSIVVGFLLRRRHSSRTQLRSSFSNLLVRPDSETRYTEYIKYEGVLARRVGAALVDYNIFGLLCFLYLFVYGTKIGNSTYGGDGSHFAVMLVAWFAYFPLAEALWGATFGKWLFKIRVFRELANDHSLKVAFKRHLFDVLDFFLFGIVAIIFVKVSSKHQRLGDMFAHSQVGLLHSNHVAA